MSDKEWLAGLKAGDEVAVFSGYVHRYPRVARVDRVTATLVMVDGGRYRKSDGWAPGNGWSRSYITELTQEHRDQVEEKTLRDQLEELVRSKDTTLAALRAANAAALAALERV